MHTTELPQSVPVQVRMDDELLTALESWRRKEPNIPSCPAAVRRLLARALAGTGDYRPNAA